MFRDKFWLSLLLTIPVVVWSRDPQQCHHSAPSFAVSNLIPAWLFGDVVLVRPGARVPADGVVAEGSADVDESMITGESRTVAKEPGDTVIAGTVAAGGSLRVRVSAVGEETALSGIMRMVAAAQASASRAQALADRAAARPGGRGLGPRRSDRPARHRRRPDPGRPGRRG